MRRFCAVLVAACVASGMASAAADAATTRVVDNTPQSLCKKPTPNVAGNVYSSIQPAINASNPNDTVLVCPGSYSEQVTIKRNTNGVVLNGLKLIANTTYASTIKAPSTITGDDYIVTVSEARNTTVSRFKISGPGPSGCNSIAGGVHVLDGAESHVDLNQVLNIRDEPFGGCQNGNAIVFGSYDGDTNTSTTGSGTAKQNTVTGYQKNGITVNEVGSKVEVSKNTVTGAGETGITAQNGIQVGYGAQVSLHDNRVAGNAYTGPVYGAAGIVIVSTTPGLYVAANTLANNQYGFLNYDQDGARVNKNIATGGQYGFFNDATSTGNTYDGNRANDNSVFGCEDDSTGTGTAGTANIWRRNVAETGTPAGICTPAAPPANARKRR